MAVPMLPASIFGRRPTSGVRTPTVLQMEAVECGAASLAMVLAWHGRWVPLEELRIVSGVTRDGARAAGIVRAARYYGLEAKGLRIDIDRLREQTFPLIVFWGFNHFVVIDGFDDEHVFINDPARGRLMLTIEEFGRQYTGIALVFSPGPAFRRGGRPPQVWRALGERLARSPAAVLSIALTSLFLALPGLVLPFSLKIFVDDVLVRGFSDWLFPLVAGLVVAGIVGGLLVWFQQRLLIALQTKFDLAIASEFFWHLLHLPMRFYAQRQAGDLANRMVGARRIAALLAGPLPTTAVSLIVACIFLLALFLLSPPLTLVALVTIGLHIGVLKLVARRRQELNSRYLVDQGALAGISMAGLAGIETIRAAGSEQDYFETWSGHQAKLVNSHQRLGAATAILEIAPQLIAVLAQAVVLYVGARLVMAGELSIGGLTAFQALWLQVATPVQQFVMLGGQFQTILGDLQRIDDVLRYPLDDPSGTAGDDGKGDRKADRAADASSGPAIIRRRLAGRLEFRGVS
ncbi:MAG: NHLP family bacteriocin export ABC transporter peptidase/permease/ATPase, partial [Alphaproteobacteria bacterium]